MSCKANSAGSNRTRIWVLAFGEEVKEAIPIFACDNNLKAAVFVALGAFERAVSQTPAHLKRHMRKDINVALIGIS